MKSKTSFFNLTLLQKNTVRFSPIWITYLALFILSCPMFIAMNLMQRNYHYEWPDIAHAIVSATAQLGPFVAFAYGVLLAMATFSYLFNARSVSLMHALPILRGGLFLTNYVSGLLFILVPNAVAALLTAFVTASGLSVCMDAILIMFFGLCAMELFFYSFAVFIAMFTGHILALPVFYAIYNFVIWALYSTISEFIVPIMYGVTGLPDDFGLVGWFTPMLKILRDMDVVKDGSRVFLIDSYILLVYAAAGIVLALLAYLAYLKRPSETAGEVVTVNWARVVFRYGVGITAGFTIGQGIYMLLFRGTPFAGIVVELICMLSIAVIGYIVAQMLLNKSFRVLRRSLHGCALCMAAILLVFTGAILDVTGATRRVPDAERVESVYVNVLSEYTSYSSAVLRGKDNVKDVVALHSYIVEHRAQGIRWQMEDLYPSRYDYSPDKGAGYYGRIILTYFMKDGTTINRKYIARFFTEDADQKETLTYLTHQVVESKEYRARNVLGAMYAVPEDEIISFSEAQYSYIGSNGEWQERSLSTGQIVQLYEALLKDAEEGLMPAPSMVEYDSLSDYVNDINIRYTVKNRNNNTQSGGWNSISLSSQMKYTIQALEDMEIIDESAPLMTHEEANRIWSDEDPAAVTHEVYA